MDAFELLLRASDTDINLDNEVKDFSQMVKGKPMYDYRDHMKNTMLGKDHNEQCTAGSIYHFYKNLWRTD